MSGRVAALQALEMIQALPSASSDEESSYDEEYEAVNAAETVAELEAKSSDSEDKETVSVLPYPFESKENMGSLMKKTNRLTALMQINHSPYEIRN